MGKKALTAAGGMFGAAGAVLGNRLYRSGGSAGPQIDAGRTDYRQAVLDRTKDSRENTLKLMAELEAQAKGEGPSAGTNALVDTSRRNLAQTLAAASMQRGPGQAASKRGLVRQQGAAERNIAEQGAIIRTQEQLGAQDALSRLAEQQQSADLQQVMQPGSVVASAESARFEQAIKAAEEARKNKGKEMGAVAGLLGTIIGGVAGGVGGAAAGGVGAVPGAAAGAAAGGAIGTGVGGVAGEQMSDENQKKDVSSAKPKVKSFLDALDAKKYTYKDTSMPGTAPGKRFGILAQDLEKSEMGKSLVKETPMGKMVDTVQGFGAVLAAQAELHKRLKSLEKKK